MFSSLRKITAFPLWVASVGTMGLSLLSATTKYHSILSQTQEEQLEELSTVFVNDTERLINSVSAIISSSRPDALWFFDRLEMLTTFYPIHMLLVAILVFMLGNKIGGRNFFGMIWEIVTYPFRELFKFISSPIGVLCIIEAPFVMLAFFHSSYWWWVVVLLLGAAGGPSGSSRSSSASTNRTVEEAQRKLDQAQSATAAERKRLEESLAKAQQEARNADNLRGLPQTCSRNEKKCATCDRWEGPRAFDNINTRTHVNIRANDKGQCLGGSHFARETTALHSCSNFETWSKFR